MYMVFAHHLSPGGSSHPSHLKIILNSPSMIDLRLARNAENLGGSEKNERTIDFNLFSFL